MRPKTPSAPVILAALAWSVALALAGRDIFYGVPVSGVLLGKLSLKWALGLSVVGLGLVGLAGVGWVAALGLNRSRWGANGERAADPQPGAAALDPSPQGRAAPPKRLRFIRAGLAVGAACAPALLLLYTPVGDWLRGDFARLAALIVAAGVFAVLTARRGAARLSLAGVVVGVIAVGVAHIVLERFSAVSLYPFSLTWSEGNRLFDYSLAIDPGRYIILDPQNLRTTGLGRNGLWGLPFLLPGASIAWHRAWDGVLWTLPYLALGWALARLAGERGLRRAALAGWVFLFLFQGPIYTPLVLSALIVVGATGLLRRQTDEAHDPGGGQTDGAPDEFPPGSAAGPPLGGEPPARSSRFSGSAWRWLLAMVGVAAAGYYASISRWTWLAAPAAWAVMILLDAQRPPRGRRFWQGDALRRLIPITLVGVVGLVGALLGDDRLFSPQKLQASTALAQPLLWYRLLPNVNYPPGLLLGLALATAPVIMLCVWLAATGRWKLHWLPALAHSAAALVFLGGGLVASVKIGGGNNLHNLDMFLITLALLAMFAWRGVMGEPSRRAPASSHGGGWPAWAAALLVLACLLPAWNAVKLGEPAHLPDAAQTAANLEFIQVRVARAAKNGQVLFVDQRQLLTFDHIQRLPVVLDYEKKFMMDKAMAGDEDYFARFYADLRAQRFALIVTEPLFANRQDASYAFQEENNAWVKWVAKPLLCYYLPLKTLNETRTQLLIPRPDPQGCP